MRVWRWCGLIRCWGFRCSWKVTVFVLGLLANCVEANPNDLDYSWIKDSYIDEVRSLVDLNRLSEKLSELGLNKCIARPLDGKLVLLSALGDISMDKYMRIHGQLLDRWFVLIMPWSKYDVRFGRLKRVRSYGVLLQLWSMNFLSKLALQWRNLVMVDPSTRDGSRLEYVRFIVYTPNYNNISQMNIVKEDSDVFLIHIVEESPCIMFHDKEQRIGVTPVANSLPPLEMLHQDDAPLPLQTWSQCRYFVSFFGPSFDYLYSSRQDLNMGQDRDNFNPNEVGNKVGLSHQDGEEQEPGCEDTAKTRKVRKKHLEDTS
ncbi:hypothetical protein Ancab_014819 [Ancistrocladus abbreviatus]